MNFKHSKPIYSEITHDLIAFSYDDGQVVHQLIDDCLYIRSDIYHDLLMENETKSNILKWINHNFGFEFKEIKISESDILYDLLINAQKDVQVDSEGFRKVVFFLKNQKITYNEREKSITLDGRFGWLGLYKPITDFYFVIAEAIEQLGYNTSNFEYHQDVWL